MTFLFSVVCVAIANWNVMFDVVVVHVEHYRRHEHREHHVVEHRGHPAHFTDHSNIEDELNETMVIRDDDQDSEVNGGIIFAYQHRN